MVMVVRVSIGRSGLVRVRAVVLVGFWCWFWVVLVWGFSLIRVVVRVVCERIVWFWWVLVC